jgi:hypothetical protein
VEAPTSKIVDPNKRQASREVETIRFLTSTSSLFSDSLLFSSPYIPTLETLCYNLEAANSHPSFALGHLKDLAFDVEKISEHLDMIDELFAKGKTETEIVSHYCGGNFDFIE